MASGLGQPDALVEGGVRGPGGEVEVPAAAFGVQADGDGEGFQQGRFAGPVLADQERDLRVERERSDCGGR